MHAKFAAWLIAEPWRAGLFSAIFGLLSPQGISPIAVLAGAIPVLLVLHRDSIAGVQAAVAGSVAVVTMLLSTGQSILIALACMVGIFWLPLGLATVLRRTASLNLSFQLAVLLAGLALVFAYIVANDAVGQWQRLLLDAATAMKQTGLIPDEQAVVESLAATNWGTYATLWLLTQLSALFVGRWWQSLLEAPGEFGREYQQLRLGQLLGVSALLIVVAKFVMNKLGYSAPLIDALTWIAVTGMAFQGLSAAHKLKARGLIGRGWLTAIYVLLVMPLSMGIMIIVLAGWGLADNWRGMRAGA